MLLDLKLLAKLISINIIYILLFSHNIIKMSSGIRFYEGIMLRSLNLINVKFLSLFWKLKTKCPYNGFKSVLYILPEGLYSYLYFYLKIHCVVCEADCSITEILFYLLWVQIGRRSSTIIMIFLNPNGSTLNKIVR